MDKRNLKILCVKNIFEEFDNNELCELDKIITKKIYENEQLALRNKILEKIKKKGFYLSKIPLDKKYEQNLIATIYYYYVHTRYDRKNLQKLKISSKIYHDQKDWVKKYDFKFNINKKNDYVIKERKIDEDGINFQGYNVRKIIITHYKLK